MKAARLEIHLIPRPLWRQSLCRSLTRSKWAIIRRAVYKRAQYLCEACGDMPTEGSLCCHEEWTYDDKRHVVSLANLKAVCRDCSAVAHAGRTSIYAAEFDIIARLIQVNGWTREQAELHEREAFALWRKRSRHEWQHDRSLEDRFRQAVRLSTRKQ
jgi:hypothetical protein